MAGITLTQDNVRAVPSVLAGRYVYVVLVPNARNPGQAPTQFALKIDGELIEERRFPWQTLGNGNYRAVAVPSEDPEVPACYTVREPGQPQ